MIALLILALSGFLGYRAFAELMVVRLSLVYDPAVGTATILVDGFAIVIREPARWRVGKAAKQLGNRESFFFSEPVGPGFSWSDRARFRIEGRKLGTVELGVFGYRIFYSKDGEITVNGKTRGILGHSPFDVSPVIVLVTEENY